MRDRWNPGSMDKSLDKKERNSLSMVGVVTENSINNEQKLFPRSLRLLKFLHKVTVFMIAEYITEIFSTTN